MTTVLPRTLGELRTSGYRVLSVKEEMRNNLIEKIRKNEPLFTGVMGYEHTVIPQVENAILSGQDIILLGERGQAKTRIARSLVGLLDELTPTIDGCEINDNPYAPVCRACRSRVAEEGDATPIAWIGRDRRYGEKLATPDITIADLIGEVDPIRVAEGRYLSDELTIHFGLVPRTNRGIFCINELPDLAERIQVGLLNILEERDVQIRGYKVRLPLDLYVVASANPEDYTNRGRIITPLKDRVGSQIRTHYPLTVDHEVDIMLAESVRFSDEGLEVRVPTFISQILAEFTHLARKSPDISQRSGVSVRVSICNYENVVSNALRRAIRQKEKEAVPRISDLQAVVASTAGKIELETAGETKEERIIERLLQGAVLSVFKHFFNLSELNDVVTAFTQGAAFDASEELPSQRYVRQARDLPGLQTAIQRLHLWNTPPEIASAAEFVLEGLHLNRKLNKERGEGGVQYRG
ncbi:MAG: magnesium chelatase [Chloroflexi bacterium]|nr:magnesium chelatase [Chloroflexota bacterium]